MYRVMTLLRIFQGRLRGQLKALWRAFWHPETPFYLKALMVGLVIYLLLPIDIIPDFLLLFGLVDDVLIIVLVLNWILSRLPKETYSESHSTERAKKRDDYEDETITIDGTSRRL